jgi:hypothetical protein
LLICFRLARDVGCTVGELSTRLTWAELMHWVAFYTREADLALPRDKRPIRPTNAAEAAMALDGLFGMRKKQRKKERQ